MATVHVYFRTSAKKNVSGPIDAFPKRVLMANNRSTMPKDIPDNFMTSLLQKHLDNRCDREELQILMDWLRSADSETFDIAGRQFWKRLDTEYPSEERTGELDRELDRIFEKAGKSRGRLFPRRLVTGGIAAACIIVSGFSWFATRSTAVGEGEPVFTEISTPYGDILKHILPDGSEMFLNCGSRAVYGSDFGRSSRRITIEGECWFDVTPDPSKPFVVETAGACVEVLGTSFNVKAYPREECLDVTVSTGKVMVNIGSMDMQLRLMPDEQLSVDLKTGELSKKTIDGAIASMWKDGILTFEAEPLANVIEVINRRYDCRIVIREIGKDHTITGKLDSGTVGEVLDLICFTTGLKFTIDNDGVIYLYEQ